MEISSSFDSGNISVVSPASERDGVYVVALEIVPELFTEVDGRAHYQWYHFRASGVKGKPCCFKIVNAGGASYPEAYMDYQSCASYDRKFWFRVPNTSYDKDSGELKIEHTPTQDLCYYAYFAPYSMEQHADLIAWASCTGVASVHTIGTTCDGYPLDMITAGTGPKKIWVIARQHPGESMAEWWVDGFLHRLLDKNDPMARVLLADATFHVVPNMCPDGARRGHLRTNSRGRNLNREWETPCADNSPEVYHVLEKMAALGCDFHLDVHGDEELPYNFIAGSEGIPGWTEQMAAQQDCFVKAYMRDSPDFQVEHGYPVDGPNEANMKVCSHAVAQRFDCLAMTLEMPFKDNNNLPDSKQGWSPERSMRFGAAVLGAIREVLPMLRS